MRWRDWKNLTTDLVKDIAGRLLTFDIAEYLRFRAACKPWRDCTANPREGDEMDARFRPRDWIMLHRCGAPSARTIVNLATGARANVNFPELEDYHQLCTADGLLVLLLKGGNQVSLFNPLTRALIQFPPLIVVQPVNDPSVFPTEWVRVNPTAIIGAGIDDSTSPCTLVLCLQAVLHPVICAKPGDEHWVFGRVSEQPTAERDALLQSPVSFGGRCYLTTAAGTIKVLDLNPGAPWPLVRFLLDEDPPLNAETSSSFLVRSQGRMLMVRYMFGANLVEGGGYDETQIFMWGGRPSCVEVFEVDIAGRRLVAKSGVGDDHATFLKDSHSFMVSTKKYPKITANSVYLNSFLQQHGHFRAYHFQDRTTTPPRVYGSRNYRAYPCACHSELEDNLIRDVGMEYCKNGWDY
jgi:hypothetical protein